MQTKNMTVTEMGDAGKGLAMLADLNVVDSDGDAYEAGAFSWKDQWAPLIGAHDRSKMPFGKARVFEDGGKAYAELHLNLNTASGKEWHSALTFDLTQGAPVQEWSYGYEALDFQKVLRGFNEGRVLKAVDVHEVSTVIRGAGAGTHTIDMKNLKAALKEGEFKSITEQLGTMAAVLQADPGKLSETGRKQLEDIHASLGMALIRSDPEAEAKAVAEIERIAANVMAGSAIRGAEKRARSRIA